MLHRRTGGGGAVMKERVQDSWTVIQGLIIQPKSTPHTADTVHQQVYCVYAHVRARELSNDNVSHTVLLPNCNKQT